MGETSPPRLILALLNPTFFADEYKKKVKEYVKRYATEAALKEAEGNRSSSESSMSEFSEDEAQDMEL